MNDTNNPDLISTAQLGKILGIQVSVTLIRSLEVTPAHMTNVGCFWRKDQVGMIAARLAGRLLALV